MESSCDTLVVGAGPYGLSLAAHLATAGVDARIVGSLMEPWRTTMPAGMFLKSEGFASSIYEPSGTFSLGSWCRQEGVAYADTGVPVTVEVFSAFGQAFARRFVPHLEERRVFRIERRDGGFHATFEDGGSIEARRVVLACGLTHFRHVPDELAGLPDTLRSHSADVPADLSAFAGRTVAVIGAGASAMDMAGLLHRAGADTTVLSRQREVRFQTRLGERSLRDRLRAPMTPIGPGWKSVLCTQAPLLFHAMPASFRADVVRRYLGPAPSWFARDLVVSKVPIVSGVRVAGASAEGDRVVLNLAGDDGQRTLTVDHVIAATGFRTDVRRIGILGEALRQSIRHENGAPRLTRAFGTSVAGLHVIGPASAHAFGPMVRFACGARFTAQRLSRHLARTARPTARTASHVGAFVEPVGVGA